MKLVLAVVLVVLALASMGCMDCAPRCQAPLIVPRGDKLFSHTLIEFLEKAEAARNIED